MLGTLFVSVPWILDIDVTVKPLYGKQEGAYNLHTPGSSSHGYLSYQMVGPWLLMGVTEAAGNQSNANTTCPGLIGMIERLPAGKRPALWCVGTAAKATSRPSQSSNDSDASI